MKRVVFFIAAVIAALSLACTRAQAAAHHAATIVPIANEPNMNGNLVRTDLDGRHPVVILKEVTDFYPQPNGGIIAVRRTSRSGFDLLYLPPNKKDAVVLDRSFAFGAVALSPEGDAWAALARPGVGRGWELHHGQIGETVKVDALPGTTKRLYFEEAPIVEGWYELSPDGWKKRENYTPPDERPVMLNKSESLRVRSKGGQVTVERVWFDGRAKQLARLSGAVRQYRVAADLSAAFFEMESGEAYAVDLHNGKTVRTYAKGGGKLLSPMRWI